MTPCELYITRLNGCDDGKVVRIEARQGAKLLSRIEVDITGFAEAVMGLGAVPAQFTTTRQYGPRKVLADGESAGEKP